MSPPERGKLSAEVAKMRTLIANGVVVTAAGSLHADVTIEGERILQVGDGDGLPADHVIDATGRYVLPGAIDPHTHLDLPVGACTSSDDFSTGTIAAALGGTTTVLDFATPEPGQTLSGAVDTWMRKAEGRAVVDFGFHVIVAEGATATPEALAALAGAGVTSVKVFMAYPGRLMLGDGEIFEVLRDSRASGVLVMLHAENGGVIEALVHEALKAGRTAPRFHAATRPPAAEVEAVHRGIVLAELADAALYVVHVSTSGAVEEIRKARQRGLRVIGETCPQYLVLSDEAYLAPGTAPFGVVMSPPLRPAAMQSRLWQGLADGDLQTIGTDHCPFLMRDKLRGRDDFTGIPNGAPGIEHRLALTFDAGVRERRLTLERWVDAVSTAPARIFGLYPRKGAIAPGADADLVIFNPDATCEISSATHHMRVDYSIYEGRRTAGAVETVLLRGDVIVNEGRFVGRAGAGRFLARAPHTA